MIKIFLDKLPVRSVSAHCDIPCGIYDPYAMQLDAHTIIRMTDLISQSKDAHALTRFTQVKEKHAEHLKREVRVLWGDYFKEVHEKEHPELAGLVKKTLQLGSKARQSKDKKTAAELLNTVQGIATIFWKTKSRETVKIKSPYPTQGDLVVPK